MSNPICPKCGGSATVTPDQFSAGHNQCLCGYRAPVRDFHQPAPLPLHDPELTAKITETGQAIMRSMFDPVTQDRAKRHVNVINNPVPHHKPVKHWSDN